MTDQPEIREMLEFMQHLSHEALLEMRALIWQLRPQGLEEGLAAALEKYAEVLGLQVMFKLSGVLRLPPSVEELMWRLSQEALNNCKKHAGASRIQVKIDVFQSSAVLEIEDDGKGFQYDPDAGLPTLGLKGMKERTEKAGGTFLINSAIGKGTKIRAVLPLKEKGGRMEQVKIIIADDHHIVRKGLLFFSKQKAILTLSEGHRQESRRSMSCENGKQTSY